MKKKSQCEKLLTDLKRGRWIDPITTLKRHSISPTCFHRRLTDLKLQGNRLIDEWVTTGASRYKRYRLARAAT